MSFGKLYLIPTPLQESTPLEPVALGLLSAASHAEQRESCLIVVEEAKVARKRWLAWGMPREAIAQFHEYNEHNYIEETPKLLNLLLEGRVLFMMSDSGLPAFCDPGAELINLCHERGIKVTATPFPHSVALALALSGFHVRTYLFLGFLPRKGEERITELKRGLEDGRMLVLMDTPYRLKQLLEETREALQKLNGNKRQLFLAMDLGGPQEELVRGDIESLLKHLKEFKREFILIIAPSS